MDKSFFHSISARLLRSSIFCLIECLIYRGTENGEKEVR
jgi:hypothetical protein